MNITPLEIRQKAFDVQFRGYDKDEVDAFLLSLSQEWERINLSIKEMQVKLNSSEKELSKLREVESSLYKTLKTAEDTSNSLIKQANLSAEMQIKETQMNAEALINDARVLAKDMIDEAEVAIKNSYDLMSSQLKEIERDYRNLESARMNLLDDLKSFGAAVLEKVNRAEAKDVSLEKLDLNQSETDIKEIIAPISQAFSNISKVKLDSSDFKAQPVSLDDDEKELDDLEQDDSNQQVEWDLGVDSKNSNEISTDKPSEDSSEVTSFFDEEE